MSYDELNLVGGEKSSWALFVFLLAIETKAKYFEAIGACEN